MIQSTKLRCYFHLFLGIFPDALSIIYSRIFPIICSILLLNACAEPSEPKNDLGISIDGSQSLIHDHIYPQLHAQLPQWMRESGDLRVSVQPGAVPLAFFATDNKTLLGSEIDIARLLSEVLGLKLHLVPASWEQCFLAIQSEATDIMVSNVTVTEARKKIYDFATYRKDTLSVMMKRTQAAHIHNFRDLAGKTVGVDSGTNQEKILLEADQHNQAIGLASMHIIPFPETGTEYLALGAGKLDAFVGPNPTSAYYISQYPRFTSAFHFSGGGLIAVMSLHRTKIIGIIALALRTIMHDGTYRQVLQRWGITADAVNHVLINPPGLK